MGFFSSNGYPSNYCCYSAQDIGQLVNDTPTLYPLMDSEPYMQYIIMHGWGGGMLLATCVSHSWIFIFHNHPISDSLIWCKGCLSALWVACNWRTIDSCGVQKRIAMGYIIWQLYTKFVTRIK